MTNFDEIYHENCALGYVEGVLESRNIDFRGLKDQLNVKRPILGELVAKIGVYRPILATRTHSWPIFMEYAIGIVT